MERKERKEYFSFNEFESERMKKMIARTHQLVETSHTCIPGNHFPFVFFYSPSPYLFIYICTRFCCCVLCIYLLLLFLLSFFLPSPSWLSSPVGQCKCRPGVIGRRCDSCPNLFAEVTLNGCEGNAPSPAYSFNRAISMRLSFLDIFFYPLTNDGAK